MTTQEVATRLVELCRKADYETAQKELYAEDAVSIEPKATPGFDKETKGLKNILEKGRRFTASVEKIFANEVSDPICAKESFACTMRIDLTMKGQGRMDMRELCVYRLKDGKIVAEEFHM